MAVGSFLIYPLSFEPYIYPANGVLEAVGNILKLMWPTYGFDFTHLYQ